MASVAEHELESYLAPFGLSAFRPGQREVIETILGGQDCLCVMPTGGGKSLCYQLPAIAKGRLTLVVSPLIALMKDQVDQLTALGLKATLINSTITPDEQYARLDAMAAGYYHLVYVVPERFRSPRFLDAVRRSQVQVLAIDEAHCISEWGHDFRPDYARLGQFREMIGNPPTIALTATATAVVRQDIVELLHLNEPKSFITGFARPNLHYEVRALNSQRDKDDALVAFLGRHAGSGIVYASSRKRCEEVAKMISDRTRRTAGIYHAGMMPEERHAAQDAFMSGRMEIVVATNAFGMGVDKANVRFVVHYNLPGSLEAYYQEAGRAGRDGQQSHCLLLYTGGDRYIHEFFIESAYPAPDVVQRVYNFLRRIDESPIELTLQDIKEQLSLPIAHEGVGACEKLLEKAGVLERLEAVENMATVRINSTLPTLVDLVPQQAKNKRRVLRAIESLIREQRNEWVNVNPRELALRAELEPAVLARTLRELTELKSFDYLPPFRGRAVIMRERDKHFDDLGIDFETTERRKAAEYEKLNLMIRYAQCRDCRQREILRYFGEAAASNCGHCDNCHAKGQTVAKWTSSGATHRGLVDAVRIVLSGVARSRGRYGKQLIAQMLCGSSAKSVAKNRLDRLSTFGLLSHLTQVEVAELIDALLAAQYLEQTDVDRFRPVLQLTSAGTEVMSGRAELRGDLPLPVMLFEKLRHGAPAATTGKSAEPTVPASAPAAEAKPEFVNHIQPPPTSDPQLVKRLRAWRDTTSRDLNVSPYVVMTNATINELALLKPRTREQLLGIKGIGEARLEQYGVDLMQILGAEEAATLASAAPAAFEPETVETETTLDMESEITPPDDEPTAAPMLSNLPQRVTQRTAEVQATFAEMDLAESEAPPLDEPVGETAEVRPNHYWTWRLLNAGFTPEECAIIRNVDDEVILDHALRSMDGGLQVEAAWFLSPELIAQLAAKIGDRPPQRIRPLLAELPRGTRYEHILLYLRSRG